MKLPVYLAVLFCATLPLSGQEQKAGNNFGNISISQFHDVESHQLTTFNPETGVKTINVWPGKRVVLGEVKGQGFISSLWLTSDGWFWASWSPKSKISPTILKTLIIRIYWDGESEPAIQAPLGDFFGNGLCKVSNYASRYIGMSSGGFYCKYPMPFRKGFKIELENTDPDPAMKICVFSNVLYQLTEEPIPNAGYLHTQFHTGLNSGKEPIHMAEIEGRGQFVGCTLSGQAEEHNYFSYLEASEYIYLDDDWEKPRMVGTGLEDYFLGGWYFREGPFIGELNGVTAKDKEDSSIAMYRLYDLDAIPFHKRFKFDFVSNPKMDWLKPFAYSSVAFYYLDSPAGDGAKLPAGQDLLLWYRIPKIEVPK